MYTQWTEMMTEFARTAKEFETVVLPASFKETAIRLRADGGSRRNK